MCIASMRSMTAATLARDALLAENVGAVVVAVDPTLTKHGCSYGVSFKCSDSEKVIRILKNKKLQYGGIIGNTP